MYRRTFLTLAAASSVLITTPALAGWDEGVAAIFSADPREGVTVTRTGTGFMLNAGGTNFNIGMPPAAQLKALKGPASGIEVQINDQRMSLQIQGDNTARVRKAGGETVAITLGNGLKLRALADTPRGRFAAIVGIAAAALGREGLGSGGQGLIMGDGIEMVFLLEATG